MRRPLRIALGIVGLAAAVYGAASLTGGWLGTPPWWWRLEVGEVQVSDPRTHFGDYNLRRVARPGREWISGGLTAAGLGLLAFAAWPRNRPADAPSEA